MEASKEKDIELEVEVNAALEKECERVEEEVLSSQHTSLLKILSIALMWKGMKRMFNLRLI
jgi:hypothetical protein